MTPGGSWKSGGSKVAIAGGRPRGSVGVALVAIGTTTTDAGASADEGAVGCPASDDLILKNASNARHTAFCSEVTAVSSFQVNVLLFEAPGESLKDTGTQSGAGTYGSNSFAG